MQQLLDYFSGSDYQEEFDRDRLSGQLEQIYRLMSDGCWRTLSEIRLATGIESSSVSAQLRNLRKPCFGGFVVVKQPRGDRSCGLWEYRLVVSE